VREPSLARSLLLLETYASWYRCILDAVELDHNSIIAALCSHHLRVSKWFEPGMLTFEVARVLLMFTALSTVTRTPVGVCHEKSLVMWLMSRSVLVLALPGTSCTANACIRRHEANSDQCGVSCCYSTMGESLACQAPSGRFLENGA